MHRATLASDSIYASIRDKEPCWARWLGVARGTSRDPMPLFASASRRAPHATHSLRRKPRRTPRCGRDRVLSRTHSPLHTDLPEIPYTNFLGSYACSEETSTRRVGRTPSSQAARGQPSTTHTAYPRLVWYVSSFVLPSFVRSFLLRAGGWKAGAAGQVEGECVVLVMVGVDMPVFCF